MTFRIFPDEPADEFPRPPTTFRDGVGREITIRVADEDDVDPLVEMYAAFPPEDRAQGIPPVGEDAIRDWLSGLLDSECLDVVAVHGDDPVGHAVLVPDADGIYEFAVFVLHSYQGAGIGTELIERLLGHGQAEGVECVWLTVERWNEPAIALYEKAGFETMGSEDFELEMAIRL